MRAVLAVLFATLLAPITARAGEPQIWNALLASGRFAPEGGVGGWLDLHARRRGGSTVVIVRPGLGYTFGPALSVYAGYAWIPTIVDGGDDTHEHRIWEQAIWGRALSPCVKVQGRLRLEQRFGEGDDVGHRVRGFVRGQWRPSRALPLDLVGWDEAFVQLNDTDWGPRAGFDQNRLFIGVGADAALRGVRVEVGYLGVYLHAADRVDHAVAVNVFVGLVPAS